MVSNLLGPPLIPTGPDLVTFWAWNILALLGLILVPFEGKINWIGGPDLTLAGLIGKHWVGIQNLYWVCAPGPVCFC